MPHTIWLEARRRLRDELHDKDYETWIEPLRPSAWSAGVLTLEVPSPFARESAHHSISHATSQRPYASGWADLNRSSSR